MNKNFEIEKTNIRIKTLKEIKKQLEITKNKTFDISKDLVFEELIHEIDNKLQVTYEYLNILTNTD